MSDKSRRDLEILVVDDDSAIREINGFVVENLGYKAIYAEDGEEGLKLAYERKPALILSDYDMPKKNGMELYAALIKRGFEDRMIMISATDEETLDKSAKSLGVENRLTIVKKPYNIENLSELISEKVRAYKEENKIKED